MLSSSYIDFALLRTFVSESFAKSVDESLAKSVNESLAKSVNESLAFVPIACQQSPDWPTNHKSTWLGLVLDYSLSVLLTLVLLLTDVLCR